MTKEPICPHCREEYDIDEHESYHLYDTNDLEELICGNCESSFCVKVYKRFSFKTEKDFEYF
jgi:uncharacterized CHY-type Zn-finger protein